MKLRESIIAARKKASEEFRIDGRDIKTRQALT